MLDIYAGKNALKTIQQHGFKQELFTNFLGASGGPKWFVLFGLDKYLFGDFFNHRQTELNIIGSSAGAYRAACFTQKDPVSAINRLAKCYSETQYSEKPTPQEITQSAQALIDTVFHKDSVQEIIDNPIFKAHFIVAKSKGLTSFENKIAQGAGLISSYLANKLDRNLLRHQYQRFVFKSPSSNILIKDSYNFNTQYIDFSVDNVEQALIASGSIPLVMAGIKDISGAPKGMYRDGGIIDYHFDIEIQKKNVLPAKLHGQTEAQKDAGLTLYPHFTPHPKAGWFDKSSTRKISKQNYDNVVMLVPSAKFIESLPFNKIPDRNDFTQLDSQTRIKYWKTVLAETDKMAESLDRFIQQQDLSQIKEIQG